MDFVSILNILLLVFGFGFVIFFHELGHFLAAKWADVRVEQFAVGFGQALVSWRKGIGARFGGTQQEYSRRITEALRDGKVNIGKGELEDGGYSDAQLAAAGMALGMGETEYRLNWVPLGGYVKMVGQDDMNPNAGSSDPRAYNRKSIGKRMIIVSAGVIMNIILAAIGFMILFSVGFHAPAPIVGDVLPNSPAQLTVTLDGKPAPLMPGDTILMLDNKPQYDFTKILLTTALLQDDHKTSMLVQRHGSGIKEELLIQPAFDQSGKFLMLGIRPANRLQVFDKLTEMLKDTNRAGETLPPNWTKLATGDRIIQMNGYPAKDQDIGEFDYATLDARLQLRNSAGQPVPLTWQRVDGSTFTLDFQPHFEDPFGEAPLNIAGMTPPVRVQSLADESLVVGVIYPDDVIVAVYADGKTVNYPSNKDLLNLIDTAGDNGQKVWFDLKRTGQDNLVTTEKIVPSLRVAVGDQHGVGIALGYDEQDLVVSSILDNSPAAMAKIPVGSRILSVNGTQVKTWFDLRNEMVAQGNKGPLVLKTELAGNKADYTLTLTPEQVTWLGNLRLVLALPLDDLNTLRKTTNVAQAAWWGITETKDFVAQFYLTIRRMVEGRVSLTNMSGPVGIFRAGTSFAARGPDWLLWFLCMISANLAVVNFLPIPIVDGGLFTFLLLEKVQGRPLSAKAMAVAQYVGLTLLISVFLVVTFMDIKHWLFF